jgi:SOS response regulatory protein OraA/RecX
VGEDPIDKSREARAKLSAFLQRRGFGWDTIRPVLAELYRVRDGDEGEADAGGSGENSDNE